MFSKIRRLPNVSFPDAVRTNPEGLNDHGDLSGFQVDGSGLQHVFVAFGRSDLEPVALFEPRSPMGRPMFGRFFFASRRD